MFVTIVTFNHPNTWTEMIATTLGVDKLSIPTCIQVIDHNDQKLIKDQRNIKSEGHSFAI